MPMTMPTTEVVHRESAGSGRSGTRGLVDEPKCAAAGLAAPDREQEDTMRDKIPRAMAAAAVLIVSGTASATADGPDYYRVTGVAATDVLNIRSEPDPHAPKVGEIPPDGICVRNLGCRGGLSFQEFTELSTAEKEQRLRENPRWCRIEYQGVTGWVAGRFLAEGSCDR
jgi:hypothetical protein